MTTPQDTEAEKRIRAMAAIRSLLKVRFQRQPLLAETYTFIYLYYVEHGYMPYHSEIGVALGISASSAVHRVNRLRRLGYLKTPFGKHRGIELVAFKDVA